MKLNHETVSLLLAVGTLATAVLALRLARRECNPQTKAKLLAWASEDAARYERQRSAWYALSVRLAKVWATASGTNFLKKEGIAAGLAPWLDKRPSRNCIKAAHFFLRPLCQRLQTRCDCWMMNVKTARSSASATVVAMLSCMTIAAVLSNAGGAL